MFMKIYENITELEENLVVATDYTMHSTKSASTIRLIPGPICELDSYPKTNYHTRSYNLTLITHTGIILCHLKTLFLPRSP